MKHLLTLLFTSFIFFSCVDESRYKSNEGILHSKVCKTECHCIIKLETSTGIDNRYIRIPCNDTVKVGQKFIIVPTN